MEPQYKGHLKQPKEFPQLPEGWVSETESLPSTDGKVHLFTVTHHPQEWTSCRTLIIVHGLGEHGGRYFHVPHYMASTVGAVVCLDTRGNGQSRGIRGHVDRFEQFSEDVALTVKTVDEKLKKRFGKSEIHLLGHSLGGLITIRTLCEYPELPLASVTVSAPLMRVKARITPVKKFLAQSLSRAFPFVPLKSDLIPAQLSRDSAVVESFKDDPLVVTRVTARLGAEMLRAMDIANKKDSQATLNYNVQVLVPLRDLIVDSDATLEFFKTVKTSKDKLVKTYDGFYHEVFNEPGKEQAFEDVIAWIKVHSAEN